jgi:hypothetical protein
MKRTEIEQMLPGIFQRTVQEGTPLLALLEVMEALPAPDETVLDQLDAFFTGNGTISGDDRTHHRVGETGLRYLRAADDGESAEQQTAFLVERSTPA